MQDRGRGFAIVLDGRTDIDGILMILSSEVEATEIASAMREGGRAVEVRRIFNLPRAS